MLRIILCLLLATSAHAAIIGVPGDQPTIQAAFDASASGDTVLVERGNYLEHLLAPPHGINLISHFPMTRDSADWIETVIDGSNSGTCLEIPDTGQEWVRVNGLVIANGAGYQKAGGVYSNSESCLELEHVILHDHSVSGGTPSGSASAMRLHIAFKRLIMKNCLVLSNAGGSEIDIHAEADLSVKLDSILFDGSGHHRGMVNISCDDSLWATNLVFQNSSLEQVGNYIGGLVSPVFDGIEVRNMTSVSARILGLGVTYGTVKNIYFHDNVSTGNAPFLSPYMLTISGSGMFADSIRVVNNVMAESDVVEFRVSPDAFNNIHTGNIDHLLVEGNRCGSTAPFGQDIGGRIAYIKNCNLRNSLITGNTSVLPIPEDSLEFWPMSDGGALNLWHFALDTLYIENVEISHNQVLDHADYWAIVNAFGPDEAGSAHRGRGLLLQLGDTRQAILRNCIFHENRLSSAWPETNVALSVGSVLRTEGGTTYPPWRTKLLIEDCSFTDNDEGAVQVTGLVDYDIRNCVIRGPHRYGIWMGANTGRIENVLIDSVLARDYVGTFKPSQQCAIVFNSQMGTDAHNVTVTNCSVRNLLAGSSPWTPQANFNSGLVANNTFQSIETHWVLDPDYDQRVHFENCYLPIVPEDGTDNLIGSEPGFDSELGMPWLSAGSECIDSGTTDSLFADLEDPDNPGFALWPSQGTLRNDIGYTGGPHAGTLDHLVAVRTPLKEPRTHPDNIELRPAFPNPFNPVITLGYVLNRPLQVELSVYNVRGQKLRTLVSGMESPGEHHVRWDASELASGVYIVELNAGGESRTQKILFLK